jgi:hypothetical protein
MLLSSHYPTLLKTYSPTPAQPGGPYQPSACKNRRTWCALSSTSALPPLQRNLLHTRRRLLQTTLTTTWNITPIILEIPSHAVSRNRIEVRRRRLKVLHVQVFRLSTTLMPIFPRMQLQIITRRRVKVCRHRLKVIHHWVLRLSTILASIMT